MTKRDARTPRAPAKGTRTSAALETAGYDGLVGGIGAVLQEARRTSARVVNALLTATYWEIGRRIVEHEQQGEARAAYGKKVLERLASDLTARYGRGFGVVNLSQMKKSTGSGLRREFFRHRLKNRRSLAPPANAGFCRQRLNSRRLLASRAGSRCPGPPTCACWP